MAKELMPTPTVNRHLLPVESDHIRNPPDSKLSTQHFYNAAYGVDGGFSSADRGRRADGCASHRGATVLARAIILQ
jgi:hypothetical protein